MIDRVEVPTVGDELAEQMNAMRLWLDSRGLQPSTFRCLPQDSGTVLIRLEFEERTDAVAFAQEFGGRLLGVRVS